MSSRSAGMIVVAAMLVVQSGCAMIAPTRNLAWQTWRSFKPKPTDYRDSTDEIDDQWAIVGKEGRGDRPLENDLDPLKRFLWSPKARSIDRNLGYE